MTTDTQQKTWTLHLTPEGAPGATVEGIPQDEMITLLWRVTHGFGSLEELAAEAATKRDEQHLIAA